MADVELLVNGTSYAGWESIRVSRSMETIAGSFDLSVTNRVQSGALKLPKEGDRCQVRINRLPVVTGYIDQVSQQGSADSHAITVSGRDLTADLVDCSITRPMQWSSASLETVLKSLLDPFKIPLRLELKRQLGAWSIHPGERVSDVIERALQVVGAVAYADGAGALVVGNAGHLRAETELEVGVNVLSWQQSASYQERYSMIRVMGQDENSISASALDATITRYRPLVVMADGSSAQSGLHARARWEKLTRQGQSQTASVELSGWFDSISALWTQNVLTRYVNPVTQTDRDMLISGVEFKLDEGGSLTTLTLVRPEAFAAL